VFYNDDDDDDDDDDKMIMVMMIACYFTQYLSEVNASNAWWLN